MVAGLAMECGRLMRWSEADEGVKVVEGDEVERSDVEKWEFGD